MMTRVDVTNELKQLAAWLQRIAPENILMPLVAQSKRPVQAHKAGQWSWEAFHQHIASSPAHSDHGILLKTLFCLDFDDADLFIHFKDLHPEWFVPGTFALARTAKGYHVIWLRSEFCDEVPLHDKARIMEPNAVPSRFLDVHGEAPIDVKTICSTGTASVLVVAPSRNKTWEVAPWTLPANDDDMAVSAHTCQNPLKPVPDGLVQWIVDNLKRRTRERITRAREGTISEPSYCGEFTIDMDEGICLAQAKHIVEEGNSDNDAEGFGEGNQHTVPDDEDTQPASSLQSCSHRRTDACHVKRLALARDRESKFYRRNKNQFYFMTGPNRRCPYREEPHDHNNFALNYCQNGDITYWCFGAACQEEYNRRKDDPSCGDIAVGKWYDSSALLAVDSMDADLEFNESTCKTLTDEWDALMKVKEGRRDLDRLAKIKTALMTYLNRFFVVVKSSNPSILELAYDRTGRVCCFDRRKISDTTSLYPSTFLKPRMACVR